jgi:hypothetical protein
VSITRAQLVQGVYGWLHRASFRSPAPGAGFDPVGTFIAAGEVEINLDLRARCMVRRAVQTVDGQYLPLPCDYLEAIDIRLGDTAAGFGGRELQYQPRREMGDARQAGAGGSWAYVDPNTRACDTAGGPAYYSIVGDEIEVWPVALPPSPVPANWSYYTIEMTYYQKQSLGFADDDTTAVLSTYPNIYTYAALVQSAPFLRDDARVQTWSGFYQAEVFRANAEHERARHQGSRLVQRYRGQPRLRA